jgi:hypothetical protein
MSGLPARRCWKRGIQPGRTSSSFWGDHSPAPLHESEEATMAKMFGYRRCDFAYRFLTLLTGQDLPFAPAPPAGTS